MKRWLLLLMAVTLLAGVMPVPVYAAEQEHLLEGDSESSEPERSEFSEEEANEDSEFVGAEFSEAKTGEDSESEGLESGEIESSEEIEKNINLETSEENLGIKLTDDQTEPDVIEAPGYVEYDMDYVNPLYAGVIQASDLVMSEDSGIVAYADIVYTSVEEAGEDFRYQMKEKKPDITINFRVNSSDESIIKGYVSQIASNAVQHTGDSSEGDYLRWQYGGYRCNMKVSGNLATFIYTMTYYTTYEQEQAVDTEIDNLLNGLGLNGKSDYEKIRKIYDWICGNVRYDYVHVGDRTYLSQFTAYAALFDRTAVCQGYTVLFYRLAMEAGIDTRVISGLGNGGAHGWNIVKLNNKYYNLDATWDAGVSVYRYFLKSNADFGNHIRDLEYEGDTFNVSYPMAAQTYDPAEIVPVDPLYNGLKYDNKTGNWYWYKDGVIDTSCYNVVCYNGSWWCVREGRIDFNYTGLAQNSNGWWYIEKGKVNFGYNSVVPYNGAWWYIKNGKLDFGYTGLAQNSNGWWYIEKGKVNFSYNSVVPYNGAWWYIKNGKLDFGYTGLAQNSNGWWYIEKGKVNFSYNSVVLYNGAWWYIKNGKLDFGYTGLAQNSNGWWYIEKGKVNFNYNSVVPYNGAWWYIKNGKLDFGYTGVAKNSNGWWYIKSGKVDFSYTGVGENSNGWWYIKKGALDWNYSGKVGYKGKEYSVVKGKVIH